MRFATQSTVIGDMSKANDKISSWAWMPNTSIHSWGICRQHLCRHHHYSIFHSLNQFNLATEWPAMCIYNQIHQQQQQQLRNMGISLETHKMGERKVNNFYSSTVPQFFVSAINWVTWIATDFFSHKMATFSRCSHLSCISIQIQGHDLGRIIWYCLSGRIEIIRAKQAKYGSARADVQAAKTSKHMHARREQIRQWARHPQNNTARNIMRFLYFILWFHSTNDTDELGKKTNDNTMGFAFLRITYFQSVRHSTASLDEVVNQFPFNSPEVRTKFKFCAHWADKLMLIGLLSVHNPNWSPLFEECKLENRSNVIIASFIWKTKDYNNNSSGNT